MSAARTLTLLVSDRGARLLRGAGSLLLELADPALPVEGEDPAGVLRDILPHRARVQIILSGPGLDVRCREVPYLSPRDRADVVRRLALAGGGPEGRALAHALDPDPLAEGGHVLWVASHSRSGLDGWLKLLLDAGATPEAVLPWQRALLAAGPKDHPGALWLVLEPGTGHLLLSQGHALRFAREFPLPPELSLREPSEDAVRTLHRVAAEQLALLLPFLGQKYRDAVPTALLGAGVPDAAEPALVSLGRDLGLPYTGLAEDLEAFLVEGAERERGHKDFLDLLPVEIREARKRSGFRATVWSALVAVGLLGAGAKAMLLRAERDLEREAVKAEEALEVRRTLAREGEEAARLRFGWLRVHEAEARQKRAAEQLEQVGLQVFQVTEGVDLSRVEITQAPGDGVASRFLVEGSARTGQLFSLGFLAGYYRHLAGQAGMELAPLKEVVVGDGPPGPAGRKRPERALTAFRIEGSAR